MDDINLQEAISMGARIISANLKRQAPVKTGALSRSITVRGYFDGKSLKFSSDYLRYGIFTDLGTGRYRSKRRMGWTPNPGVGKKGIRPRYWTTLERSVSVNIKKTVTKIIKDYIKFQLTRKK
jgi:hypothetical protein